MMSRGPSFTSGRRTPSFRVNALAFDVQSYVQQEAVVEGVLHVSSAQAHSCLMRFDDIDSLGAPELPALSTVLTKASPYATSASSKGQQVLDPSTPPLVASSSLGERILQEAFCLASPAENPVDDDGVLRRPRPVSSATTAATSPNVSRTITSNSSNSTHRLATSANPAMRVQPREPSNGSNTMEAVERLGIAASQHASCSGLTREVLRSSEARARIRRRKLLHLFRSTLAARDSIMAALHSTDAAHQLTAFGSSLASLMSWDDIIMTSSDEGSSTDDWLEAMAGAPRGNPALAEQSSADSAISVSEYTSWVSNGSDAGCVTGDCSTCMHRLGPLCAKGH